MSMSYTIEYAKSNRSNCKKSKEKIEKGALRIGKLQPSPFDPDQMMCTWFLPGPFFEMMRKMRKESKKVETVDDLQGFTELNQEDQDEIQARILSFWDTTVTVTKKPPAKKRVKPENDDDDEPVKKASPKKAKPTPLKKKSEPHESEVVPCTPSELKELAKNLVIKARQDGVKMPTDDIVARQGAGAALMQAWDRANGTVDLGACLDTLEETHGTTKGQKSIYVVCEENRGLAESFKELAGYFFQAKNQMKGISFMKVFRAISNLDVPIRDGKQAAKLEGIGKSSATKIDQFILTGKIDELEQFRSGAL